VSQPTYASREALKAAANVNGVDEDAALDRVLQAASRAVERSTRRRFYPSVETRVYDYPARDRGPYRLWLDGDLLEVESLTSAGVEIADYFLEPANYGPPYNRIEIDLAGGESFQSGDTWQRQVAVEGVWGYCDDEAAAGALAEADDGSETALDVTDSSLVGVGDLIHIGDERLVVTEKALLTTGTTIAADLAADNAEVTVAVASGPAVKKGEIVTVDAERLLVVDVAGDNLVVKRAWDGSVLAAHTSGATVYAPRTLTVVRGAAGTTAATHSSGAAIARNVPPGLVTELVIAEAIAAREQEKSGYGRNVGQGDGARELRGVGLADLRDRVDELFLRRRTGAV